jgi:hypothetical protein
LAHEATVLKYIQRFLIPFPVFCAYYDKISAATAGHAQWDMLANHLFDKGFQAVSKLVHGCGVHWF